MFPLAAIIILAAYKRHRFQIAVRWTVLCIWRSYRGNLTEPSLYKVYRLFLFC